VLEIDEPLVAIAPLFILHPAADTLDGGYLAWLLGRPSAQRYFASEAMGTGIQMISKNVLAQLPVSLPPLPTQRTIVAASTLAVEQQRLELRASDLRRLRADALLDRAAAVPEHAIHPTKSQHRKHA
jgi:hypothetical protein